MRLEDKFLFICTRQNFNSTHRQELATICRQLQAAQWDTILTTAQQHGVAPLIYANLSKDLARDLAIPQDVLNRFKSYAIYNVCVKQRTAAVMKRVLALCKQKSIDVMVVKGEALSALVYDQPWYTASADVDLVIKPKREQIDPEDHRQIRNMLEEINHEQTPFKEHIEYDYFEHHDVTMNNVLAIDSEQIWREAHKIQLYGHDVMVMTPEDMLIAVAVNSCRKRFFRLKSLSDIAEIIRKYPDLNWRKLTSRAREYKCNTIIYTALLVTQMTLGCSLPDGVLADLHVNPIRASLIRRSVYNLSKHASLVDLSARSRRRMFGREFSWPLVVTYATYRLDLIGPKMREIYLGWRNPSPQVA